MGQAEKGKERHGDKKIGIAMGSVYGAKKKRSVPVPAVRRWHWVRGPHSGSLGDQNLTMTHTENEDPRDDAHHGLIGQTYEHDG